MFMDRWPLVLSTACFFVSFGWTMFALGAGRYRRSRFNLVVIALGFVFQSMFLYARGQAHGRCPLTSLFETMVFLSWAMVLFYLAIGPAYRLTLLGAFTAPFATVFQLFALLALDDRIPEGAPGADPWLELHAAVSVVAYGAFALACVAGVMYLAQERQLKTRHIGALFFHLPPIADLAVAIRRLLIAGLALLSVGLGSGFVVGSPAEKVAWGASVWAIYGVVLLARPRLSPKRFAFLSVAAFAVTLGSLWGINHLPVAP